MKRVIVFSCLFVSLTLQAQIKPAVINKPKTGVRSMNLVDSLKNGRYAVIVPDYQASTTNNPDARRNDPGRELEPANIMFISAKPAQSVPVHKIVLNAGILNRVADPNFSANLEFSNGVYQLKNSQSLQYIQLERGNLNQRASLSCQLKKNKRYLISFDVMNKDMISSPRVYQVSYQNNMIQYSIDYTLTDRGQISFVLDTSGTGEEKPNVCIALGTTRTGSFLLFSCSIEEL